MILIKIDTFVERITTVWCVKLKIIVDEETSEVWKCFFFLCLGGVENCGQKIDKEYTFEEGTQSIDLTLCGNPQPKLSYTFKGETKDAEMTQKLEDSNKMYRYKINLDSVNRKDCGSPLTFKATGFKEWYNSSIIKVKCKNYISASFLL